MKYLLTIVLLCSFSQAAAKGFLSGSEILDRCEAYLSETGSVARGETCVGYVMGITDAHGTFTDWGEMSPLWCTPDNMSTGQMVRVVTKYLQEHPEDLHLQAASLVSIALRKAFPCK